MFLPYGVSTALVEIVIACLTLSYSVLLCLTIGYTSGFYSPHCKTGTQNLIGHTMRKSWTKHFALVRGRLWAIRSRSFNFHFHINSARCHACGVFTLGGPICFRLLLWIWTSVTNATLWRQSPRALRGQMCRKFIRNILCKLCPTSDISIEVSIYSIEIWSEDIDLESRILDMRQPIEPSRLTDPNLHIPITQAATVRLYLTMANDR